VYPSTLKLLWLLAGISASLMIMMLTSLAASRFESANSLQLQRIPSQFHVIIRNSLCCPPGLPGGRSNVLRPFFEVYWFLS
jgi:hypothetical protein